MERDDDRYDLQYRTAADDKVREQHRAMNGITLPSTDPFWKSYYPPNGWNCRCTAVQVLKDKYPAWDPVVAMQVGDKATGSPKQRIFRFNPGIDKQLFPPKHPYYKLSKQEAEKVKEVVIELMLDPIGTPEQLADELNRIGGKWFEHGMARLYTTTQRGVNGFTYMDGRIYLTPDRMDNAIKGVNHITEGGMASFDEEDALATLWHEITHNRNKHGNVSIKKIERMYMELANEFVARKTLPEFFEALGGELHAKELLTNRTSTSYNTMVRNYDALIDATHADRDTVMQVVQETLFNKSYTEQKSGLVNALSKGGAKRNETQLTKQQATVCVEACCKLTQDEFTALMKEFFIH